MGKFIRVLAVIAIIVQVVVANVPTVVITPFGVRGNAVSRQDVETITDLFVNGMATTRRARIITRADADFNRIMKEHGFQVGDWSDNEKTARFGRVMNAQAVINGEFSRLGNNIVWTARMINVQTGEILATATDRMSNIDQVLDKVPTFTTQMVNNLPKPPAPPHPIIGRWQSVDGNNIAIMEFLSNGTINVERYDTELLKPTWTWKYHYRHKRISYYMVTGFAKGGGTDSKRTGKGKGLYSISEDGTTIQVNLSLEGVDSRFSTISIRRRFSFNGNNTFDVQRDLINLVGLFGWQSGIHSRFILPIDIRNGLGSNQQCSDCNANELHMQGRFDEGGYTTFIRIQ